MDGDESDPAGQVTAPERPGARVDQVTTPERPGDPERPRASERDITGYDVGREIGRGGMGRVVTAHDRDLGRTVAIKRLHAATGEAAERFRREAHLTARLQHPGIVPVYAHGEDADGAPYYAMRLVEGTTLATAIDEARTIEQRIALVPIVLQVADTIAYAHAQQVIHRDLKPGNIMLGTFGETLVVDWGLAKDLAADDIAGARMTGHGTVMGTPSYMAPEQAAGEDVDERTDVYALGAILYHVLAGAPPFAGSYAAAMEAMYSRRPEALATRAPDAPPALIAIAEKGMAERPEDRYTTARDFAEDLRRFQTGQLVAAHRYTIGQHAARLARRYRNLLIAVVAAIVAAGVVGAVMFARVLDARDVARTERDEAIIARAHGELDRDPSRVEPLVAGIHHADVTMLRASARAEGVAEVRALGVVPTAIAEIKGRTWIGDEDGSVTVDGAHITQLSGPVEGIAAMGDRAVAWGGAEIVVFEGTRAGTAIACAGGAAMSTVAPRTGRAICAGPTGTELVELATGERRVLHEDLLTLATLDRTRIVARDGTGQVHAFDATTLAEIATLPATKLPTALVLAGDRIIVARGTEVLAWDPSSGALDAYADVDAAAHALVVSGDGARLAVLQIDGTLRIFDARSRRQLRRIAIDKGTRLLGFEPGGDRLALTVRSELHLVPVGVARRWRLLGHAGPITDVAWSTRGPLSVSQDGTLRAWRLDEPIAVAVDNAIVQPRAAFAPDGTRLLAWDLSMLREVTLSTGAIRIVEQNIQVASAAYASDGAIVVVELDGRVRRNRVELGRVEPGPILAITTSPDGGVVIHGAAAKHHPAFVRAWDRDGKPRAAPAETPPRRVPEIVASGSTRSISIARPGAPPIALHARGLDGARQLTSSTNVLAVVSRDDVCIFAPDRTDEGYCLPHDRAGEAWFSPDGHWLATSAPGELLIWSVPAL